MQRHQLRFFCAAFAFLFCLQNAVVANTVPKQPPAQQPTQSDPCKAQARRSLCPAQANAVSVSTQSCIDDWRQTGCEDYLLCLDAHKANLTSACLGEVDPSTRDEMATLATTTIALVFFVMLLLVWAWAFYKFSSFERQWRKEKVVGDPFREVFNIRVVCVVFVGLVLLVAALATGRPGLFALFFAFCVVSGCAFGIRFCFGSNADRQQSLSNLSARTASADIELTSQSPEQTSTTGIEIACFKLSYFVDSRNIIDRLQHKPKTSSLVPIVTEVSATFLPGFVTAIIGPSGCGKTTLLNLLTCTCNTGCFSGQRVVNKQALSDAEYRRVMMAQGYVPQCDTLSEHLTVRETLVYSAMLRLPQRMALALRIERVDDVIAELGLTKSRDTIVGGETRKGISGGQRRRLTIAIEMLRLPSVLFLDEPTSGLDGTTSLKLMKTLNELSRNRGCTVVTTIHQPRVEILELIDRLLLLDKRGHATFHGATADAIQFFQNAVAASSLDPANYTNQLDFIIDALDLDSDSQHVQVSRWQPTALAEAYLASELATTLENDLKEEIANAPQSQNIFSSKLSLPFFQTVWVLLGQRCLVATRQPVQTVLGYLQVAVISWIISDAFSYSTENPSDQAYQQVALVLILSSYAMIVPYLTLVPEFFVERGVMNRDHRAGVFRYAAYVTASMLQDVPRAVTQTLLLLGVGYAVADLNSQSSYAYFFFVCLMVGVCAWQSVICLCSMLTDDIGVAYSLVFIVLGAGFLFGGIVIVASKIPSYFLWAYYISIPALTSRALVVNELYCCGLTVSCANWNSTFEMQNTVFAPTQSGRGPPSLDSAVAEIHQSSSNSTVISSCPDSLMDPDPGNLGRATLQLMELGGLEKYLSLILLLVGVVAFRVLAVLVLHVRAWSSKRRLQEIDVDVAGSLFASHRTN